MREYTILRLRSATWPTSIITVWQNGRLEVCCCLGIGVS